MTYISPNLAACPANYPALNFISLGEMQARQKQETAPEGKKEDPCLPERCPANFPALNFTEGKCINSCR